MSGFEVIGVILGGLPLVISCLEYYTEEFEALEELWDFRKSFIELTDDIRVELLKYKKTMVDLLEPVIADQELLESLSNNLADTRWTDGSLIPALKARLGEQQDLFLRTAGKIEEEVQGLKRLMQIKDEKTSTPWIPMTSTANQRSLNWHFNRFRICFDKGKHKKVKKLAIHNDKLREILHCSSSMIPVLEAKKRSAPVSEFEKLRQNASGVYNALKRHIRCSNRPCAIGPHRVGIILHAGDEGQKLQFLLQTGSSKDSRQQETSILRGFETEPMTTSSMLVGSLSNTTISFKSHEETIRAVQVSFQNSYLPTVVTSASGFESLNHSSAHIGSSGKKTKSGFKAFFSGAKKKPTQNARFALPQQQVAALEIESKTDLANGISDFGKSMPATTSLRHITDFCLVMHNMNVLQNFRGCEGEDSESKELGLISDEADHCYKLLRNVALRHESGQRNGRRFIPETTKLAPIMELLPGTPSGPILIGRNKRLKMAAQVAAALLQILPSPWISISDWSYRDFLFLTTDGHQLFSENPCIFQQFDLDLPEDMGSLQQKSDSFTEPKTAYHGDEKLPPPVLEKVTRDSLFKLGVMLTELLFGKALFTSKEKGNVTYEEVIPWVDQIMGEAGPELAEAVRRCVSCNFASPRDFGDRRFRELVFEGVVKPFRDALLPWA